MHEFDAPQIGHLGIQTDKYAPIKRAKDEVIAYLRDGSTPDHVIETLTQAKEKGGLYDYFAERIPTIEKNIADAKNGIADYETAISAMREASGAAERLDAIQPIRDTYQHLVAELNQRYGKDWNAHLDAVLADPTYDQFVEASERMHAMMGEFDTWLHSAHDDIRYAAWQQHIEDYAAAALGDAPPDLQKLKKDWKLRWESVSNWYIKLPAIMNSSKSMSK